MVSSLSGFLHLFPAASIVSPVKSAVVKWWSCGACAVQAWHSCPPLVFVWQPLYSTPFSPARVSSQSTSDASRTGSGVGVGTGSKSSHRGSHSSHLVSASVV